MGHHRLEGEVSRRVQPRDVRAAPLLVGPARRRQAGVHVKGLATPVTEPVGLSPEERVFQGCLSGNHGQPTEPSISSWMSRFSSTAYSSGSSLVNGSMKPLTIMVSASARGMPRLIR